jgi:sarcosine oxidase subunit alpha
VSQVNRLADTFGLLLDRRRPVHFEFEGEPYEGFEGDTIASALAANDQWILSRSFKYHRPRAALTMAGQDANTLVQIAGEPNCLADRTPISAGLAVFGQNYSGSLKRDRGSWVGFFSRFLGVGFYYHAFYRPRGIWELWAKYFRRKAGLGRIDTNYRAEGFDKRYRFCDVAVVGAGPAGLAAALDAAASGAEVLLIDENSTLGGSLNYSRIGADAAIDARLRIELVNKVLATRNIEVMTDTIANGCFADNWLSLVSENRLHKLRAGRVVLCSGVMEQPALFRNNDVPGVMMGSAAQRLIKMYGVRPGKRALVLAGNDDAYGVVLDLIDAGVEIAAVVELRDTAVSDSRALAVAKSGTKIISAATVFSASSRHGRLASVEVRSIISEGQCGDQPTTIECDLLCMSVGFMPAYQLACQIGGNLNYDDASASFSIHGLPAGFDLSGSVAGTWTNGEPVPNHHWPIFAHPQGDEFVDLDEDLKIKDIVDATKSGYEHIQLVKRYSTCGMGPSQGRHSALAAARLVAKATQKSVAETGVTTARPPFSAETLAHCAGRQFHPALRTNMHQRHAEAGASFLLAGNWYRPAYYGNDAESAIRDEVNQVRKSVGLIDVSTLGGIEVMGPDAAEFLNRIYTFAYKKQAPGTVRYALMTNDAGVVVDDGVACRLSEEHYYVTATTSGVDRVYRHMLQRNAQWHLDVCLANVSSAYCGVNIAGPRSAEVLQPLCDGLDLSAAAFPYLGVRLGKVAGIDVRVLRVGFVGDLGYEIHAPQHCGEALWDALMAAGADAGIRPVGIEAQRMLRLEKGHIIIGQDTDATTTPMELQMTWAIAKAKPYFVGKRSLDIHAARPQQRTLVGFSIDDTDAAMPLESHLVVDGERLLGRVTSSGHSPTLDKLIGLAYVDTESSEPGTKMTIRCDEGALTTATVVTLPFFDPDNSRQELPS